MKKVKNIRDFLKRGMPSLQKGQSLIEALLLSLFVFLCVPSFFMLSWLLIQKILLEHYMYQALICRSQQYPKTHCESQLKTKLESLLPLGEIRSLHLSKNKGELLWRFYKKDFPIRQSFQY